MVNKEKYIVPEYYHLFKCKGNECKYSCCRGFDIYLSLTDYFHMQTLACNKKLRYYIDRSFEVTLHPSKDKYAKIRKNYHNDCSLHMRNGLCRLQSQCGEDNIPSICHYFP